MDRRAALQRLKKLAIEQHQILNKLAQMPEQNLEATQHKHGDEANQILAVLPQDVKASLQLLEVPPGLGQVKVRFLPGKANQVAYDTIINTVSKLQKENVLPGTNYHVSLV